MSKMARKKLINLAMFSASVAGKLAISNIS